MLPSSPRTEIAGLVRRFLPYLRPLRRPWFATAGLLALDPLIAAALLWSVKLLIDEVFVAGRMELLPFFAALYAGIVAIKLAAGYASTRLEAAVTEAIAQQVRTDLYRHLVSVSPGSLRKHGVGDLLAHLSDDVERIEFLIYTGLLGLTADAVGAVLFVSVLLLLSWKLTLCALLIAPLLALLSWRLAPRTRRAERVARRAATAWMALAEERLGATPIVHAFGAQAAETAGFARRCRTAREAALRAVAVQSWMSLLIETVTALGGLLVLVVGAFEIRSGNLTIGTLVAFLGSIGSLYGPVRGLAKASGRFQRAAAGAQRVADLLDTPSLVTEAPGAKPLPRPRGSLDFCAVRFGYTHGQEVLHGISLKIEPDELVAVVGPSGSGKSTLVRLALRLHDPCSGAVRIDGHDLRDVTLDSLRRAVAVVFQEPHLVRGSIAENIGYGQAGHDPPRVAAVAAAAHVNRFADALPAGCDAQVGPRGVWLSGGERQRVALARALLRDCPILLLDEATAAVDSETEALIHDAVDRLAGRRTMLIVGHRLSSIRRADRLVVVEDGRIVESGTPAALLRNSTRCRDLFAAQLGHAEAAI